MTPEDSKIGLHLGSTGEVHGREDEVYSRAIDRFRVEGLTGSVGFCLLAKYDECNAQRYIGRNDRLSSNIGKILQIIGTNKQGVQLVLDEIERERLESTENLFRVLGRYMSIFRPSPENNASALENNETTFSFTEGEAISLLNVVVRRWNNDVPAPVFNPGIFLQLCDNARAAGIASLGATETNGSVASLEPMFNILFTPEEAKRHMSLYSANEFFYQGFYSIYQGILDGAIENPNLSRREREILTRRIELKFRNAQIPLRHSKEELGDSRCLGISMGMERLETTMLFIDFMNTPVRNYLFGPINRRYQQLRATS